MKVTLATLLYPFYLGWDSIKTMRPDNESKTASFLMSFILTFVVFLSANPPLAAQTIAAGICYLAGIKQANLVISGNEFGHKAEWALVMSGVVVGFLLNLILHIFGIR